MRNFVLYLDLDNHLIPIGSSNASEFKEFSTYNENLDEAENDQYTLTFSVVAKSYTDDKIQWNPLLSFYHMGAKMRLLIDGHKRIDLIIKGVAPKTNQLNTEWNITAQDEVSYLWSKQHITQVYSTTDGNTDILKPKNIYDICDELIVQNYLEPWQATRLSRDPELTEKTITLDNVQNNPYQILIEACNTVGANMSVDYASHTIDFYRKNLVRYSGYRYHPARNLEAYDVDYSGEETTTWLHVHGGEDANGMTVTMIPALPAPVRQYIKDNISKIDAVTWEDIYNTIGYKTDESTNKDYIDTNILNGLVNHYINYSLVHIDKIQVNGITYTHGSDNIDLNVFGQDEVNKNNYVKFIINENTSYTVFLNSNPGLELSETQIEAQATDDSAIIIFRTQQSLDIYRDEYTKTLKQELLTFARISKEIPYLGQYLIDFKPFKHSMTKEYWDYLQELINTTLFHYNLKLQYYSSEYYSNLIQLIESRNYLEKVLGEKYLAACSAYIKDKNINNLNDIEKYKAEIKNYIEKSSYINSIKNLGQTSDLEINQDGLLYWRNLIQKQKELINSFTIEQNNIRKLSSDSNGMIEYYNKLLQQSTMLITDNITPNTATVQKGLYPLIIDYIKKNPYQIIINNGIAKQYEDVQTDITNNVFKTLYSKYGQYLYENTYENAEELDSVSLYNQAITYFADLNRIQSSHSLTVLDIGSLDAIAVPRLSVGSVISVYNPDTPAMQPYAPLLEKVEIAKQKYENLKNWTAYINDANLHKALINQAHAEYINATEAVLEKYNINNPTKILDNFTELENLLYQDTVIVTGISRVLREPLRDSVTVEQSSRYKSILAKLIKSI